MTKQTVRPASKAIIERNGRILVLESQPNEHTYWILPGGKVEYGESPLECLKRELREELSCEVSVRDVLGVYHFLTGPDSDGDQVVSTVFDCSLAPEEKIDIESNPAEEGIVDYHWLTPEELIERRSDGINDFLRNNVLPSSE